MPRHELVCEHDRRAQVDVERAVDLLDRERLQRSRGGKGGVGDQDVHLAGFAQQPRDLRALGEVHRKSATAELARERFQHLGAPTRQDQLGAAPCESTRAIAWPMPPVAPVSSTVDPEICTRRVSLSA